MLADDWPSVAAIYAEGVTGRNATFETETPTWEAWDGAQLAAPRLVAELDGELVGFAAVSPVSSRQVYRGVAEVTIYVATRVQGRGIGRALLGELVVASEAAGIWTLEAGMFPENVASIRLHESCGFRRIGVHERLGEHHGVWRDVVLLERRSPTVG
jgi:L-amino acid N-acyltransferase YncA